MIRLIILGERRDFYKRAMRYAIVMQPLKVENVSAEIHV